MAMDGEGAHGCERGEDQVCLRRSCCNATLIDRTYQDFERKAALFSLASSDVMIVNLWEHQVDCIKKPIWVFSRPSLKSTGSLGKRTKVGISCFVITRPELMRDFSPNQQTLLVFVIRDHL